MALKSTALRDGLILQLVLRHSCRHLLHVPSHLADLAQIAFRNEPLVAAIGVDTAENRIVQNVEFAYLRI